MDYAEIEQGPAVEMGRSRGSAVSMRPAGRLERGGERGGGNGGPAGPPGETEAQMRVRLRRAISAKCGTGDGTITVHQVANMIGGAGALDAALDLVAELERAGVLGRCREKGTAGNGLYMARRGLNETERGGGAWMRFVP